MHYKTLVQSARQYEEELDKAEVVERDTVEKVLTEKLELARKFAQLLRGNETLHLWASLVGVHELLEL